ncbi:hypothetical protein LZ30DRAFT_304088 [Colletotrichum cereale]|nr:hypothetical protein LZ30DRAFT_304088 [Colletotrichum cereale]
MGRVPTRLHISMYDHPKPYSCNYNRFLSLSSIRNSDTDSWEATTRALLVSRRSRPLQCATTTQSSDRNYVGRQVSWGIIKNTGKYRSKVKSRQALQALGRLLAPAVRGFKFVSCVKVYIHMTTDQTCLCRLNRRRKQKPAFMKPEQCRDSFSLSSRLHTRCYGL